MDDDWTIEVAPRIRVRHRQYPATMTATTDESPNDFNCTEAEVLHATYKIIQADKFFQNARELRMDFWAEIARLRRDFRTEVEDDYPYCVIDLSHS